MLREAGGALLGGHSVRDAELKFGLAVIGEADPDRLLTNADARPGHRLILTKPLGTGVLVNAFKVGKLDEAELEPALVEMERLNARASRLALAYGAPPPPTSPASASPATPWRWRGPRRSGCG